MVPESTCLLCQVASNYKAIRISRIAGLSPISSGLLTRPQAVVSYFGMESAGWGSERHRLILATRSSGAKGRRK